MPQWLTLILVAIIGWFARTSFIDIKVDIKHAIASGTAREIRMSVNEERIRQHGVAIEETRSAHQDVLAELKKLNQATGRPEIKKAEPVSNEPPKKMTKDEWREHIKKKFGD